ncbi:MAG TPA: DUF2157 domain-containing protein [Verrucomicrobiae bacterium]|nr:DUF2157 domain-containing protein [Verrucomicrobiae bacterium]
MNRNDVQKLCADGFISEDQRGRIIEHYKLAQPQNRFLTLMLAIGGTLVLTGIVLVISANWDAIPGLVKIFTGALLMIAAHFGGWRLAAQSPRTSAIFHFLGAGMFLANIALVGQVYHLSSRSPNAMLLWLAGIIPLIFILRSTAIHVLALGGLFVWLGMEINSRDGYLHFASHISQFGIYAGVGLLLYGLGLRLKRTTFTNLAAPTQLIGMMAFHFGLWPTLVNGSEIPTSPTLLLMGAPAVLGLMLMASELRKNSELSAQWRTTWIAVFAVWLLCAGIWMSMDFNDRIFGNMGIVQTIAAICLIAGSVVQMRVAEELREPWLVNLAIVTTGYSIIVTFGLLIGSMMNTGLIFLVGGAGILALGFWLEKKRRAVIQRIHA